VDDCDALQRLLPPCQEPCIETGTAELIGEHPTRALRVAKWFYERFNWDDPSEEVLRADQARLLSGFRR